MIGLRSPPRWLGVGNAVRGKPIVPFRERGTIASGRFPVISVNTLRSLVDSIVGAIGNRRLTDMPSPAGHEDQRHERPPTLRNFARHFTGGVVDEAGRCWQRGRRQDDAGGHAGPLAGGPWKGRGRGSDADPDGNLASALGLSAEQARVPLARCGI